MQSSGMIISDLKTAILKDGRFDESMAAAFVAGTDNLQDLLHRTHAVREDMAEWLVSLVDPAKVKDDATFGALVAIFRLRLAKTVHTLLANHDKTPTAFDLYWDG